MRRNTMWSNLKNNWLRLWILLASYLLLLPCTWAEEYSCPLSVHVEKAQVKEIRGWETFNLYPDVEPKDGTHTFRASWIAFKKRPDIVIEPDDGIQKKNKEIYTIELEPEKDYVLSCSYKDTHVVLYQPVLKNERLCETTVYLKNGKRISGKTQCRK